MSDEWSTITLRKKTKKKLDLMKVHKKQSYDELITDIIKNKKVLAAYYKMGVKE